MSKGFQDTFLHQMVLGLVALDQCCPLSCPVFSLKGLHLLNSLLSNWSWEMNMTPKGEDVIYSWESCLELVMFLGSTLFGAKVRGSSPFLTLPLEKRPRSISLPCLLPFIGVSTHPCSFCCALQHWPTLNASCSLYVAIPLK